MFASLSRVLNLTITLHVNVHAKKRVHVHVIGELCTIQLI